MQIASQRFRAFHCDNQRDLAFRASVLDLAKAFADRETLAGLRLGIQSRNLIKRYAQTCFRLATASPSRGGQIPVLDVNRRA